MKLKLKSIILVVVTLTLLSSALIFGATTLNAGVTAGWYECTSTELNVRSWPGVPNANQKDNKVGLLYKDELCEVTGESKGAWNKVRFISASKNKVLTGWVNSSYLKVRKHQYCDFRQNDGETRYVYDRPSYVPGYRNKVGEISPYEYYTLRVYDTQDNYVVQSQSPFVSRGYANLN